MGSHVRHLESSGCSPTVLPRRLKPMLEESSIFENLDLVSWEISAESLMSSHRLNLCQRSPSDSRFLTLCWEILAETWFGLMNSTVMESSPGLWGLPWGYDPHKCHFECWLGYEAFDNRQFKDIDWSTWSELETTYLCVIRCVWIMSERMYRCLI